MSRDLVALISDIHFGIHSFDTEWMEMQMGYFKGEFRDTLNKLGIKDVFILGDLLDNRKTLNIILKDRMTKLFSEELSEFNFTCILGNHDVRYRDTNEVTGLGFLSSLPNFKLVKNTTKVGDILLVPWVHQGTSLSSEIGGHEARYCFGHFELGGFAMNRKSIADSLEDGSCLNRFPKVFTGHYHTKSTQMVGSSEVSYLGSPFQFTRIDSGDRKGFVVLDLQSGQSKHVRSTNIFRFVSVDFDYVNPSDEADYARCLVDISVSGDDIGTAKFKEFKDKVDACSPLRVTIIPKPKESILFESKSDTSDVGSICDVLDEYVEHYNSDEETKALIAKTLRTLVSQVDSFV